MSDVHTVLDRDGWLFAVASFGAFAPMAIFALYRNLIFVSYFGASAEAIGAVGIVLSWYNAFNGLLVAKWADAGTLNRSFLFPTERWGRRAPWMVVGLPIYAIGTAAIFLPPSLNQGFLNFWYGLCYFLVATGFTAVVQSYLASIQELWSSAGERAKAIFRNAPFTLGAYIFAGVVVPAVAFSQSPPSLEDQCCIEENSGFCSADPMCGCYSTEARANASAAALNDTLSFLYDTRYARACAAELARHSVDRTHSKLRSACAERAAFSWGSFALIAALVVVCAHMVLWALPAARKSPQRTQDQMPSQAGVLQGLRDTLGRDAFRVFTAIMWLGAIMQQLLAANITFFLLYVNRVPQAELGGVIAMIAAITLGTRLAVMPCWLSLLHRNFHPARLYAVTRAIEAVLSLVLFSFAACDEPSCKTWVLIVAACLGVLEGGHDMMLHALIGWIIDEDAIDHNGRRREGMHYATNGMVQHTSDVVLSGILFWWGTVGLDGNVCPGAQPRAAIEAISSTYKFLLPVILFIMAILGAIFPIKGQRLERLLKLTSTGSESGNEGSNHGDGDGSVVVA